MNITALSIGPESGIILAFDDDVKRLVELDPVVVDWINVALDLIRQYIPQSAIQTVPMIYDMKQQEEREATQADLDQLMAVSMAYAKLNGRIDQAREEGKRLLTREFDEAYAQL